MTKQEAIEKHRALWNWVADETERTQNNIKKENYFENWDVIDRPTLMCFCCQYDSDIDPENNCRCCPIYWNNGGCSRLSGLYTLWEHATSWEPCATYARQIAELPEAEIYFRDTTGTEISLSKLEEKYELCTIYNMIYDDALTFVRREKKGE